MRQRFLRFCCGCDFDGGRCCRCCSGSNVFCWLSAAHGEECPYIWRHSVRHFYCWWCCGRAATAVSGVDCRSGFFWFRHRHGPSQWGVRGLLLVVLVDCCLYWQTGHPLCGSDVMKKTVGGPFLFCMKRMIENRLEIDLQMHFSPPNKLHHFSHQSTLTWLDVMLLATLWYHRPTTNSFSCTVTSCNLFPNPNNSMQDKTSNNMCKHRLPQLA